MVTTLIFPVVASAGTVAVMRMSEFIAELAGVPLNATFVVCMGPVPLILTDVPTGPLVGLKLATVGSTLKVCALVRLVDPVRVVLRVVGADEYMELSRS